MVIKRHQGCYCNMCALCFTDNIEFEIHMSMHKKCHAHVLVYKAASTSDLNVNVKEVHPETFPCNKCDNIFVSTEDLYTHFKIHKESASLDTDQSQISAEKSKQSQSQVHAENACQTYPCDQEECTFSGENVKSLVKHIFENHIEPSLRMKCEKCEYIAEDINVLNVHKMSVHKETQEFQNQEMMQYYFRAIYEALVDTNEEIHKISEETKRGFAKIVEDQNRMATDVKKMKDEAVEI